MTQFDEARKELDRIESSFRLRDPETAPAETRRILDEERRRAGLSSSARPDAQRARIFAAGKKFMEAQPAYHPCRANEQIVFDYVSRHDLDPTSAYDLNEAFLAVRDKLIPPPKGTSTPRRHAVRKVNGVEISHEALDAMSAEEFARRMNDPRFEEAVNGLPPRRR